MNIPAPEHKAVIEGPEEILLSGPRELVMGLNGIDLRVRPRSFFPTNTAVTEQLYRQVAGSRVDAVAPRACGSVAAASAARAARGRAGAGGVVAECRRRPWPRRRTPPGDGTAAGRPGLRALPGGQRRRDPRKPAGTRSSRWSTTAARSRRLPVRVARDLVRGPRGVLPRATPRPSRGTSPACRPCAGGGSAAGHVPPHRALRVAVLLRRGWGRTGARRRTTPPGPGRRASAPVRFRPAASRPFRRESPPDDSVRPARSGLCGPRVRGAS
ncbi:hypothetical protein QJS66_11290 [Kocuria rhizophila]|nr:hypothetical protein QJS66_11290 [Kocuria rhizophila]